MASAFPSLKPPPLGHGAVPGVDLAVEILRAWAQGRGDVPAAGVATGRAATTLLAQNRLLGLTGALLLKAAPDDQIAETTGAFRRLTAEMNGASLIMMRRLTTALAGTPARVIFYKGVVLQQNLYGTPFARPASDIDLLTAPATYAGVARALQLAGHRLDPHTDTLWWRWFLAEQQFRVGVDAQNIDLHHRLQQPGCPMPRRPDRLIAESILQSFLGGQVRTFRDDHTLLVAAMSLAKALHHREPAGRYVGDVERLLRRLSPEGWSAVAREAAAMGLTRTLDLAIRCVQAVFQTVPAEHQRAILPEIDDLDLQCMLLAPAQAPRWVRRRRLLLALCDRPIDAVTAWLVMAASETARRATEDRTAQEPVR